MVTTNQEFYKMPFKPDLALEMIADYLNRRQSSEADTYRNSAKSVSSTMPLYKPNYLIIFQNNNIIN